MDTFTIHNAKSQFSKLLSRVELGEEIIIANRGIAVARLVHVENKRSRSRSMGVDRGGKLASNCDNSWLSGSIEEVRQQTIDAILLNAYEQGFFEWSNLFRDKLQLKATPLSGEGVWQHCWQELNRFNDRVEGLKPEPAPQIIEFNLQKGTIGENVRTRLHSTSVMMRYASAVPSSNRDHIKVDRRYVGSLLLKLQPKVFEEAGNESYQEVQVHYLSNLMAIGSAYDYRIVLELSRSEEFGVRYKNQQLIQQNHYRKKETEEKGQVDVLADEELKAKLN